MSGIPARDTVDVILDGAMRALARHGSSRLSMTDICRESGVSRGTLYRYFASRDEVLTAVNLRISSLSKETFDRAVAEEPAPEHRVRVILHAMLNFPNTFPHMRTMFKYEPKLSLDFLIDQMPGVIESLVPYLEPALADLPAARAGLLTARDLAEFLYRIVTSSFFIPTGDSAALERKISALWDFAIDKGVEHDGRRPLDRTANAT
ncbi:MULTISPECIES: TetR/AcrR family transcriptional regulator [Nocardia]|uniref:TetR/AcrR family transcriptional regulator n=1 Tax=Nocardia TaxID=1817 RepID=UPI000D68ABB6|nr:MULTISPECIES: TetR/AcrR family transcriptional regulator [Nocardia]